MRSRIDGNAINAVVVLTDGVNNQGNLNIETLKSRIQPLPGQEPIRVFTIAYGFGSKGDSGGRDDLQEISKATEASQYNANDPRNPQAVANDLVAAIISNF